LPRVILKERIGLFYGPIIFGRFLELISAEAVKADKAQD